VITAQYIFMPEFIERDDDPVHYVFVGGSVDPFYFGKSIIASSEQNKHS